MAENNDLEQKLQAGVEAARKGDRATARRLLEQVVIADENNELAWIWLASSVNTLSERRACLEKVLQINPENPRAREALQKLSSDTGGGTSDQQTSQTLDQLRRAARKTAEKMPSPRPKPQRPQINIIPWLVALVIIGGVIGIGVLSSEFYQRSIDATPTYFAPIPRTSVPRVAADTGPSFDNASVRIEGPIEPAPTLPPTFTPTLTPTPTASGTPTKTPYPVSEFIMYYTRLNPGDVEPNLYRSQGDGSDEQLLATAVQDIAIAPGGDKIAFVRNVTVGPDDRSPSGGTWPEIFVAPLDNLDAASAITDIRSTIVGSPSWSPDGLQLVFVSDFDGDEELWAMTDDGLNIRQLTANEGSVDRDPAWSPNGNQIVFASDRDTQGSTEIFSLQFVTNDEQQEEIVVERFTDDTGSSYSPTWSQDGSLIAFISDRGGDGDVFIMDDTGMRDILLTYDDGGAEDRSPVFSPDNQWVVFVSDREDDIFQLYYINLDGKKLVRVTQTNNDIQSVTFQPEPLLNLP